MQQRHKDRALYFQELAQTSRKYFLPYIGQYKQLNQDCRILEIGCGDGGNLLPFAQMGCYTLGVDIDEGRIADARKFFADCNAKGDFIASDVFLLDEWHGSYSHIRAYQQPFDVIICHDVIEHIADKRRFLSLLPHFLARDGLIFVSFPAWQMPFGGHQQICRNKIICHLPFVHLLPKTCYRLLLKACGEEDACINELLSIKETRTPIELFERVLKGIGTFDVIDRTLWFINPHYEAKFELFPLSPVGSILAYSIPTQFLYHVGMVPSPMSGRYYKQKRKEKEESG